MTSNIEEHCKGVNSASVYNRKLLKFPYCWCGAHLDAVPFEIRIRSRISISFGHVLSIKTKEKTVLHCLQRSRYGNLRKTCSQSCNFLTTVKKVKEYI